MPKILIAYATVEGQTEKIAAVIKHELLSAGFQVDLFNVDVLPPVFDFSPYDAVIIGASVHMLRFPQTLHDWVRENASGLSRVRGAFFSVCLGILERDNAATQATERKIVTDFFDETGWHPGQWTIFAGALQYSKYNWFKKQLLKTIVRRSGGDTDTTHDYEYTDWSAVKKFAVSSVELK